MFNLVSNLFFGRPETTAAQEDLESEVNSLRGVLELKMKELHDQRLTLAQHKLHQAELQHYEEENKRLVAKIEDLDGQLGKVRKERDDLRLHLQSVLEKNSEISNKIGKLEFENDQLSWQLTMGAHKSKNFSVTF